MISFCFKAGTFKSSINDKILPTKVFNERRRLAVGCLVNSQHQQSQIRMSISSPFHSQPSQTPTSAHRSSRHRYLSPASLEPQTSLAKRTGTHARSLPTYHLEVVQQPLRAAEFGSSSLTRLPLAPPLIVQLVIRDLEGNVLSDEDELPFLISHLSLLSADAKRPLPTSSGPNGFSRTNEPQGLLYGSLASSPQVYRDLQGRQGIYFLFPDVSVRTRGYFQMCISLIRLPSVDPHARDHFRFHRNILAETRTETFQVLAREEYTAPSQTPLTRYFLQQGARMTSSFSICRD